MFRRICQCKNVNRDDRLKSLRVIMILSMWSEVNFVSSKEFLERFYINNNTVQFISNVTRNLGKKTGSVSKPSLARLALQRRTGLRIEKKRAGGRAGEEERRRKAIVASVVTVRRMQWMQPCRSATKDSSTVYYANPPYFFPLKIFYLSSIFLGECFNA